MGSTVYPAATSGQTLKTLQYTTTGESTFTLPSGFGSGNPLMADVTILGGGGGGGAGYWTSTSNYAVGGGGGGGGFFQGTVPLTSNMTVRVGAGGAYVENSTTTNPTLGSNGGASYIGNGTIKNMFINPTLTGYQSVYGSNKIASPFALFDYSGDASVATAVGQNGQIYTSTWASPSVYYGQAYQVKASTNYCFSMYFRTGSASNNGFLRLQWLNSAGDQISVSDGSNPGFSTSWVRMEVGASAPSTATHVRLVIMRTAGTSTTYCCNPMLEEGVTTASTYVDGNTSGYKWVGTPFGSPTILATDTMYIVNGGGGGGSAQASQGDTPIFGFAGACSGGGGIRGTTSSTTYNLLWSGDGGGLGGNAVPTTWVNKGTTSPTELGPGVDRFNSYADHSFGTNGNIVYGADYNQSRGTPGPSNSFGYGRGGRGTFQGSTSSHNDFQFFSGVSGIMNSFKFSRPNSGDGGNATMIGQGQSSKYTIGAPGGSGLVIIKYWS